MHQSATRRRHDVADRTPISGGRRVAQKRKPPRSLRLRVSPAVAGVLVLALAATGALFTAGALPGVSEQYSTVAADYAGSVAVGTTDGTDISRGVDRAVRAKQIKQQAAQTAKALAEYRSSTTKQAAERSEQVGNQWVLPTTGYVLTARFGSSGSHWSSGFHTGLDFAVPVGTPVVAVAAATVTETGYAGAYGNRTEITLGDGTQIWYCHQSRITVTVGQKVQPGQVIGYSGNTGNTTGPHLHIEVHYHGSKTASDPYTALVNHGVTP